MFFEDKPDMGHTLHVCTSALGVHTDPSEWRGNTCLAPMESASHFLLKEIRVMSNMQTQCSRKLEMLKINDGISYLHRMGKERD